MCLISCALILTMFKQTIFLLLEVPPRAGKEPLVLPFFPFHKGDWVWIPEATAYLGTFVVGSLQCSMTVWERQIRWTNDNDDHQKEQYRPIFMQDILFEINSSLRFCDRSLFLIIEVWEQNLFKKMEFEFALVTDRKTGECCWFRRRTARKEREQVKYYFFSPLRRSRTSLAAPLPRKYSIPCL